MGIRLFAGLALIITFSLFTPIHVFGQIDFLPGTEFRYLKGMDAAALPANWNTSDYDDTDWSLGITPFRYGDGTGGTQLDDMRDNYSVLYLRSTFTVGNANSLSDFYVGVNFDDGFKIFINGVEVLSRNAPTSSGHEEVATTPHESGEFEIFILEPEVVELVEGENILAVQAYNISLSESGDFYFDMGMLAEVVLPVLDDSTGLDFNVPSGFYEEPFFLEITASNPDWKVVYTLDGSNPQDSDSAIITGNKATILIDPTSSNGRPATPSVTVRASSMIDGILPSFPEVRTYIYLDEVKDQIYPGGDWPPGNVDGQVIDYPMDSRVVYHPSYVNKIVPSLEDIPSISVVTDLDNLFDPGMGIYVNAWGHGMEWERESSVELINPDGSEGFNVNAGLRIRGGWSRHDYFPKHSFRLFFRSDYGDAKLYFPLFGEEGVDRYDKIDLRTSQNYAWAQGDGRNTMLRDVFSRDLQRDMGQPYTRSRHYHLYLNGMYWGLFQTQERSEARFAADYLGGNTNDYDVIKVNTEDWQYRIEATDGYLDTWEQIWDMSNEGFSNNANYFQLLGRDSDGVPLAGAKVLLDVDNLIDFMLTIFYTANFDAPVSSFLNNKAPNNFYAIYNREDHSRGFMFFNHDAEHSMFADENSPGTGLYENRVNLAERTGGKNMDVSNFDSFHPQWLHHKLSDNAEYRQRFMDRAYLHMEGNGALTASENLKRLNQRAEEIDMAIIAESARWGDGAGGSQLRTRNDDWVPQSNKIRNDFFPYRTGIVIEQLENAGLYTGLDPAIFIIDNVTQVDPEVIISGPTTLTMKNLNSAGAIYYTIDGTDPRAPGGTASLGASQGGAAKVIDLNFGSSAVVKARIQYGNEWSALKEIKLLADQQDYSSLVVTELHYHPTDLVIGGDTTISKDLEFIEFKNIGTEAINLGGMVLDSAIYYEFPVGTLLPPNQFYVVASKPSAFYLRYGLTASGNYKKNLSNGGEEVLLVDPDGNPVVHFIYSDVLPWPIEADGQGNSLVSVDRNPEENPAWSTYWKASVEMGGSPFMDEPNPAYASSGVRVQTEIVLYPNPTSGLLNVKWEDGIVPQEASFELFGLNGKLLYQTDIYGNESITLDHLNLTSGVYVVKITTPVQVFRKRIIFQ